MPGEDGYALIRRIRRLSKADGGDIPAIALTAHARDEDRRHAISLWFQEHLATPVNVAELVATLRRLAGERDNHASRAGCCANIVEPRSARQADLPPALLALRAPRLERSEHAIAIVKSTEVMIARLSAERRPATRR
jgi:DNA-binding response OmpR family regulator